MPSKSNPFQGYNKYTIFYTYRGWWTPLLFTSAVSSAKYFYQHVSRQNTLTQARRNISRHYDLVSSYCLSMSCIHILFIERLNLFLYVLLQSNKLFSLFLDESMTYSCAIFKVRVVIF